ncbi:MAG: lysophospholipid acyltransferase family protein [Deltaproteobacteria bacterium]|nr:lysophospholipid acyltransferase family protein [Deltaproteobacteria bacterium]
MAKIKLSKLIQNKFNIYLYHLIGWNLARYYIFFLGKLYFFINKSEKDAVISSVTSILKRLHQKVNLNEIIKNVFNGIISHYYEKMFIGFEKFEKKNRFINENIICDDMVVIRKTLLKGKGAIVITGHYGAIEYIPALFGLNGINVSMIAKFKTEKLKNKIISQAAKYNARFIDTDNNSNILLNAVKELKENRVLVTQCDEFDEWRPSKTERISFLGHMTGLDRTINAIKKRSGAEILFGVIIRSSLNKYKLKIYSYEDMLRDIPCGESCSAGEVVLKTLEQFIYRYPEQWYHWEKFSALTGEPNACDKVNRQIHAPLLGYVAEKSA